MRKLIYIISVIFSVALWADSSFPGPVRCQDCETALEYEARIGIFSVGSLSANVTFAQQKYELSGVLAAGGPIRRLLSWRGSFAAKGEFQENRPITETYLLIEDEYKKEERKVVLVDHERSTIHETGKPTVELATPTGIDIMSALLLNPGCVDQMIVHDGEDSYAVNLWDRKSNHKIHQGRKFYSGYTELCRYQFEYSENHIRKVDIWMAEVEGFLVPVRIRVRVPVLPDGLLKLRLNEES